MAVLGIDLGKRRIGLAISDASERIALPAGIVESRGLRADVAALRAFVAGRDVRSAVIGLPLHMSGRAGPEAEAARSFAAALASALGIPVELQDERWSTLEAERTLREAGQSRRKRKAGAADTLAATLILRTYLERRTLDRPGTP